MKSAQPDFRTLLQKAGHKATPGRILLLQTLLKESEPVAVAYIQKKLKGALDKVTLYRGLESLVESGIVREADFRHGHAHYELNILRKHHHHIVCTDCGTVEDAECNIEPLARKVAEKSLKFNAITDHSTEFFGLCNSCTKV